MLSDSIVVTLITVGGGLLTAYVAWLLKNRKPRPDTVADALKIYEAIIKRLDAEVAAIREDNNKLVAERVERSSYIDKLEKRLVNLGETI